MSPYSRTEGYTWHFEQEYEDLMHEEHPGLLFMDKISLTFTVYFYHTRGAWTVLVNKPVIQVKASLRLKTRTK